MRTFDCWYIGTHHTKEEPSKILNIEVAISLSSYQNTSAKLLSCVLWSLLFVIKTIRRISKWFILAQIRQKLEFVSLKYVAYTQLNWVSLTWLRT